MSVTNLYRTGNWLHRHHILFDAVFVKVLIRLFFNRVGAVVISYVETGELCAGVPAKKI